AGGTTVAGGAELDLAGGINIGAEALTLNGTGAGGGGALRSAGSTNTFGGNIVAATSSTISTAGGTTLNLGGSLNKNGVTLTLTGGGTINVNGAITGSSANSDLIVDNETVNLNTAAAYNGPTTV